jgi:putative hemolysin
VTEIIVILLLMLLNAFFALSEMSIVSASKPLLRQKAKEGNNRRAQLALKLAENPGIFLSTVQVGITLIGIVAGAYGGANLSDDLTRWLVDIPLEEEISRQLATVLVVSGITFLSVVIGELVPKRAALYAPETLAMLSAPIMWLLSIFCKPIVALLNLCASLLLKLLGILHIAPRGISGDELRAVMSESVESGVLEKSEHEMVQRIMRLAEREVTSIMTHRKEITAIDLKDDREKILAAITASPHSRYPVIEDDIGHIVGLIPAPLLYHHLMEAEILDLKPLVQDIMYVPETVNCQHVLELFKTNPQHMVVVIDEYGETEGIVTTSDLLEAVVGLIPHNYGKRDSAMILQRADGSWLIDGITPVEEVKLALGMERLPGSGGYDTVAGFVLHRLGAAPMEGLSITVQGYCFEIIDMDGRRIDKLLVTRIQG